VVAAIIRVAQEQLHERVETKVQVS